MADWFDVTEIKVREHTSRRPGSRPCLMVVYELDGHKDAFDFLAFESDEEFAREKAHARWLDLQGDEPVPTTTAEAIEREGEPQAPLRVLVKKDGDWERIDEVDFDAAKAEEPDESLEADRRFLDKF
jgi:hypothetical protein